MLNIQYINALSAQNEDLYVVLKLNVILMTTWIYVIKRETKKSG